MDAETNVATVERRTRQEIRQIVAEFASSGLQQSEFCRSRGISRSTLDRHLRKQRGQSQASVAGNELLAVELRTAGGSSPRNSSGLVVVLVSERRIEVSRGFDAATLERLLSILERG
jgi:AraC-like DNA-binding protein